MEFRFFEIYRNPEYLWLLLEGVGVSAGVTLAGAVLGFIMALGLSAARYEQIPVLKWIAAAYVDFIRNTPLIVQLFFVTFGLPLLLGYVWPFWAHAVLALTLNFGFFMGEIENPDHHSIIELFFVIVVNLIATILKLGDRSQIGAVLLATSLVADLELIAAAIVWTIANHVTGTGLSPEVVATVVSLAGGALVANIISVTILVVETLMLRR